MYEALSYQCMGSDVTSAWGLKILVYEVYILRNHPVTSPLQHQDFVREVLPLGTVGIHQPVPSYSIPFDRPLSDHLFFLYHLDPGVNQRPGSSKCPHFENKCTKIESTCWCIITWSRLFWPTSGRVTLPQSHHRIQSPSHRNCRRRFLNDEGLKVWLNNHDWLSGPTWCGEQTCLSHESLYY